MRIVYSEAKVFQSLIEAMGKIVDEVALVADEDKVTMKAIDPAQVVLMQITIPKTSFLDYEVEGEEKLGFEIANLVKFLKRAKKGYQLELGDEEEGAKLRIVLKGNLIKKYVIPNLEVAEVELPDISQLEYSVEALLLASVIKEAIRDIEAVSDAVVIEAPDENTLLLKGVGPTETVTRVTAASSAVMSLTVKEPAKAAYDLTYLKHIVSLTKVSDNVTLRFANDAPLYMRFDILAGGYAEYVLAPQAL